MKLRRKLVFYVSVLLILFLLLGIFKDQALALDAGIYSIIAGVSNPALDFFFISFTYYGSIFFWLFLTFLLWVKKDRKLSIHLAYALIIDGFLSFTLKSFFQRPRPDRFVMNFFLAESDTGSSFPSGHAEKAFSGSTILSSYYKLKPLFYAISALTAISRVYIGAHYPLDVLFGSLIGLIVGEVAIGIPTKKAEKTIESLLRKLRNYASKTSSAFLL
jgi:undecaprenyl-diphosphatase